METSGMEETVQPSDELSVGQKVIGVFTSPGQTFESIDKKPSWIVPFIITVVIGLGFVYLTTDIITSDTLTQQEEEMIEQGMDSAQIEQALGMTEKFMKFFLPAFTIVGPLVFWAIIGGVFMFVGNVILGGSSSFKKVYTVTAWSWLIHVLGSLILLPLVLAKETIMISFSPAAMMSDESRMTFMYQFLSKFDLFNIWFVAVLAIGLAVVYKMKTQKMVTAAFVVFLIWALGSAGWSQF